MIPTLLQDFLVEDLKTLGFNGKNAEGNLVSFNVYPQYLPAKKGKKDADHFPYVTVIIEDGEDPNEVDPSTCRILLMFGVYDLDENYQGYKDILNVLQKTYEHLMETKIFAEKYSIEYPVNWRIHDEDTYPYFFGAIETNWTIAKTSIIDTLT
jgi:hypothetical protein